MPSVRRATKAGSFFHTFSLVFYVINTATDYRYHLYRFFSKGEAVAPVSPFILRSLFHFLLSRN